VQVVSSSPAGFVLHSCGLTGIVDVWTVQLASYLVRRHQSQLASRGLCCVRIRCNCSRSFCLGQATADGAQHVCQ
jgi:hypothetical protein